MKHVEGNQRPEKEDVTARVHFTHTSSKKKKGEETKGN
jgi:hypothetical protein